MLPIVPECASNSRATVGVESTNDELRERIFVAALCCSKEEGTETFVGGQLNRVVCLFVVYSQIES